MLLQNASSMRVLHGTRAAKDSSVEKKQVQFGSQFPYSALREPLPVNKAAPEAPPGAGTLNGHLWKPCERIAFLLAP